MAVVLASVTFSVGVSDAVATTGFVTSSGTQLFVDGNPFEFTGINIYNANSDGWCGAAMNTGSALDDALSKLGGEATVMRSWFFQPLAINKVTRERDWSAFDHTLDVADAHGVKVIATLTDQWGECGSDVPGNGAKQADWYESGYTQVQPGMIDSYRDWVIEVVDRYKNDPRIAFWQLINEGEIIPCSPAPGPFQTLYNWAADVSSTVKSIDPNHLVSLGTMGSGQCGAQESAYQDLHSLPWIDLCEYHDYGSPSVGIPGDEFNGLQVRIDQCNALSKPIFVGEAGIIPNEVGGTLDARAVAFRSKIDAQRAAGVRGFLAWAWSPHGVPVSKLDDYDIGPDDPALAALRGVASAPQHVVATPHDGYVTVTWEAPTSEGRALIDGYTVTASPDGATCTGYPFLMTCDVVGLTNETPYTLAVTAHNALGDGPAATETATPSNLPSAPMNVVATPHDGVVTVTWDAPTSEGGAPIYAYVVTASPGGEMCVDSALALTCEIVGLGYDTEYTFSVTASNPFGAGPPSSATATLTSLPGAPTNVVTTPHNGYVTVAWQAPTDQGGAPSTTTR